MLVRTTKPLGVRSHVMKDHVYIVKNGHIFTSASIARKVTLSGYAAIVMTTRYAPFDIQVDRNTRSYRAVAIKTPVKRVVYADNVRLTGFHLNPLHPMFRALQSIQNPGLMELPRAAFEPLDEKLDAAYEGRLTVEEAKNLFEQVVASASNYLPTPRPSDARIDAVLSRLQSGDKITLAELASSMDLSMGRMRHLFADTVGISFRSFSLWQKMHRVPMLLAAGKSLTEAAYDCGFADSAHMAAAFQQIHGAPPSYFFNSSYVRMISRLQKDYRVASGCSTRRASHLAEV